MSPSEDAAVFFRQTGQSAPLSALIGKPAGCACRHGVAQAYSLDPMPPPPPPSPSSGGARAGRRRRGATARINSGLLKLTCPALVRAVDELEDSGAMGGLNARLARDGAWREFVEEAHGVHAAARRRFVFGDDENDDAPSPPSSPPIPEKYEVLRSRLGDQGARAFLSAGVAGASPGLEVQDVKCLHAWLADYLFRAENNGGGDDKERGRHPLGEAVLQALRERGVDASGTESCRASCTGAAMPTDGGVGDASSWSLLSSSSHLPPPVPRNKQRKRGEKESARKQRRKAEEREGTRISND